MIPAVQRFNQLAGACCVIGVLGVPAFAQSNSDALAVIALDRSSTAAVREYASAELAYPAHMILPPNLHVSPVHRALLESMLRRSATFRRQCQRIAYAPQLTIKLYRVGSPSAYRVRARTLIIRQASGALSATIEVPPLDDDVELIAHEIEHVIEQLDQVDLASKAAQTGSGVHTSSGGETVFETTRARRVGLMVAEEFRRPGN